MVACRLGAFDFETHGQLLFIDLLLQSVVNLSLQALSVGHALVTNQPCQVSDDPFGCCYGVEWNMLFIVGHNRWRIRQDNGTVKMHFDIVDFSQLVSDAALSFQLLYEERQMGLQCAVPDGVEIHGSEQHLYQVLDVLLDNALKYSAPGSMVCVDLASNGKNCLLSVSSAGEPISKEDLKNIFKRFYRADKARSMNGSYGLGLSIAESIVEAHKGKIWAESGGGYNTFFVQLPTNN